MRVLILHTASGEIAATRILSDEYAADTVTATDCRSFGDDLQGTVVEGESYESIFHDRKVHECCVTDGAVGLNEAPLRAAQEQIGAAMAALVEFQSADAATWAALPEPERAARTYELLKAVLLDPSAVLHQGRWFRR